MWGVVQALATWAEEHRVEIHSARDRYDRKSAKQSKAAAKIAIGR